MMETDLYISAKKDFSESALTSVYKYRNILEKYIMYRPEFLHSLRPISTDPNAHPLIRDMIQYSEMVGVGPMASVAGAVAEYVSMDLLDQTDEIIVENGGDIYLKTTEDIRVAVYAGESPLSMKIKLKIKGIQTPLGICTSSGTIGHSLSFGNADAVCIISPSAILSDAAATAVGNRIKKKDEIRSAIDFGSNIKGVLGILVIMGDYMGAYGQIEIE